MSMPQPITGHLSYAVVHVAVGAAGNHYVQAVTQDRDDAERIAGDNKSLRIVALPRWSISVEINGRLAERGRYFATGQVIDMLESDVWQHADIITVEEN